MNVELNYRVRHAFEPGTELIGNVTVKTPEEYLIEKAVVMIGILDQANPRGRSWSLYRGELDGLLLAIAVIQAGSSYFSGDEPRKIENAIREWMKKEVAS